MASAETEIPALSLASNGNGGVHAHSLAAVLWAAGDVGYVWNLASDAIEWFGDYAGLFGADLAARGVETGEGFNQHLNIDDLAHRLQALEQHYTTRSEYDCEYRCRGADGHFRWLHDKGQVEWDVTGRPIVMRGILRSVNRRKQYESQLEQRVNFDDLTGHFNRQRLRDRLNDALKQSQRYSYYGAFLCVGIDKMALVNEVYGQAAADAVIVAIGQRLESILRNSDSIGRMGGDGYGIVLSRCPPEQMEMVADKILRICRDQEIMTSAGPIHVRVSIGGVAFPSLAQSAFDIMTRAETALHQAKSRGRDCFIQYIQSAEQLQAHRAQMEMAHKVMEAVKLDRVMFAYQPIVRASDTSIAYYEALLRMYDDDGSIMPAYLFIPAVEQVGLTRLVDRRVLELAVLELERHPDLSLAINISGLTVAEHSWLRVLIALVKDRPEIAARLIVEITETEALQDIDESARFVQAVRDLGCRVALDDFGAGYTSFRHLKSLTVDIVKIDGSYIKQLHEKPDHRVFVRSLIDLARCFGLSTVAECVETKIEADLLRAEGVGYFQGYYYGRPEIVRATTLDNQ